MRVRHGNTDNLERATRNSPTRIASNPQSARFVERSERRQALQLASEILRAA